MNKLAESEKAPNYHQEHFVENVLCDCSCSLVSVVTVSWQEKGDPTENIIRTQSTMDFQRQYNSAGKSTRQTF